MLLTSPHVDTFEICSVFTKYVFINSVESQDIDGRVILQPHSALGSASN